jgi:hypothetical protein
MSATAVCNPRCIEQLAWEEQRPRQEPLALEEELVQLALEEVLVS